MTTQTFRKLMKGLILVGIVWAALLAMGAFVVLARPADSPYVEPSAPLFVEEPGDVLREALLASPQAGDAPVAAPERLWSGGGSRLLGDDPNWPYTCTWGCTANDMQLLNAYVGDIEGNPVCHCEPGELINEYLWLNVYNNTGTNRYGVPVGDHLHKRYLYAKVWQG